MSDYEKMAKIAEGLTELTAQYGVEAVYVGLGFEPEPLRSFLKDGAATTGGDPGLLGTGVLIGAVLYGECTIDELALRLDEAESAVMQHPVSI